MLMPIPPLLFSETMPPLTSLPTGVLNHQWNIQPETPQRKSLSTDNLSVRKRSIMAVVTTKPPAETTGELAPQVGYTVESASPIPALPIGACGLVRTALTTTGVPPVTSRADPPSTHKLKRVQTIKFCTRCGYDKDYGFSQVTYIGEQEDPLTLLTMMV